MPGGVITLPESRESNLFYEDIEPDVGESYGSPPHQNAINVLAEYGEYLVHYAQDTAEWWLRLLRNPLHPPPISSFPLPLPSYNKNEFMEDEEPQQGLSDVYIMYGIKGNEYQ